MRKEFRAGDFLVWLVVVGLLLWALAPGGLDLAGLGTKGIAGRNTLGSVLDLGKKTENILRVAKNQDLAQAVAALPVRRANPNAKYDRARFGKKWADVDHNGCDTRNDILRRDMTGVAAKPGTHECVVAQGVLNDPYTGKTINFRRGEHSSSAVQIDHVVALMDAWNSGAYQWDENKREQYANDPLVLLAADGPANQAKGASSADQWMPSNNAFHCAYIARQVAIKQKWSLSVTAAEQRTMALAAKECPQEPLPVR
ncbi:MAG: HNH endonuclease family protein [Actinomycetaceae bacterium]|nr:HNH endonuclease family protein [Actinomycetaceae bacterium]